MVMKLFIKIFILFFISSSIIGGCAHSSNTYPPPVEKRSIKTSISDSLLHTKVKSRLSKNIFVDARFIIVHVFNRVVTLTGTVKTESMRLIAADSARSVNKVLAVKNHLEIKY
jgi:osmotically-inducible protein OsmY